MIAANVYGIVELTHRVPAEGADELRVAMDIVREQTKRLEELAVTSSDADDGSLLLGFSVTPEGWGTMLDGCGGDEIKARRILGKIVVGDILSAAHSLKPNWGAASDRPS